MKRIVAYTHRNPDADEQQPDSAPGPYFVSVRDGSRTSLLSGPYTRHIDALGDVERVKALAMAADWRAHFYAFGTVRMRPGVYKTVFGRPA